MGIWCCQRVRTSNRKILCTLKLGLKLSSNIKGAFLNGAKFAGKEQVSTMNQSYFKHIANQKRHSNIFRIIEIKTLSFCVENDIIVYNPVIFNKMGMMNFMEGLNH